MTMTINLDAMPECWRQFYQVMEAGIPNLLLHGPPGTGKTFAGLNVGQSTERGAHRLICTETMTEFDIVGGWMPDEGAWTYHEGAGIRAWEGDGLMGGRLVVDEIDKANGDPLGVLLAITDSHDSAKWMNPQTKRWLKPRDGFSVVATTNIENLRELPEALLDRFPVAIRINEPHPHALDLLPADLREQARIMADGGDNRVSLRKWTTFADLREQIDAAQAAKIVFGTRAQGILDAIAINKVGD